MVSSTTEALNRLIREFMAGLRTHLQTAADEDPEVLVERIFAAIASVSAAVLLVLPLGRRRDGIITALFALAARHWAKRAAL